MGSPDPRLADRTALVTGARRGIGRVVARELARAGARVVVADRDPAIQETADDLVAEGYLARALTLDVGDGSQVRRGLGALDPPFDRIDLLVSNAGIVDHIAPLIRMSPEGWSRELNVNLSGAFHLLQAVLPAMVENRFGRIVLVSSVAAVGGLHRQAGYAASKAGLLGLAKTVALEHARDGITCNAILPGLVETETVAAMPPEIRDAAMAATPARRFGRMQEVAGLVLYLVSEEAGYVNGAEIRIDGGFSLNTGTLASRKELRRR